MISAQPPPTSLPGSRRFRAARRFAQRFVVHQQLKLRAGISVSMISPSSMSAMGRRSALPAAYIVAAPRGAEKRPSVMSATVMSLPCRPERTSAPASRAFPDLRRAFVSDDHHRRR